MSKSTEVTKSTAALLDVRTNAMTFSEEESTMGLEGFDSSNCQTPALYLLQRTSEACSAGMAGFKPGAEPGMWYNNISERLYRSAVIVPCFYVQGYSRWLDGNVPSFRGFFSKIHPAISRCRPDARKLWSDTDAFPHDERTMYFQETSQYYCLLLGEQGEEQSANGPSPVVISLSSSALGVSRHWNSRIRLLRSNGNSVPLFGAKWSAGSEDRITPTGSWKVPSFHSADVIQHDEVSLYKEAKALHNSAKMSVNATLTEQVRAAQDAAPNNEVPF